jgi:hypothetical protein
MASALLFAQLPELSYSSANMTNFMDSFEIHHNVNAWSFMHIDNRWFIRHQFILPLRVLKSSITYWSGSMPGVDNVWQHIEIDWYTMLSLPGAPMYLTSDNIEANRSVSPINLVQHTEWSWCDWVLKYTDTCPYHHLCSAISKMVSGTLHQL